MKKINIVVTDDHKLFRKGIMALLSDFDFIGDINEAGNGVELISLLKTLNSVPDVILLDLRMPEMDGFETQKRVRELFPDIKIIILTMEDDEQFILHLIQEGVNGYLLKNAEPEEMELALKNVMEKGFYFSEDIANLVMASMVNQPKTKLAPKIEITDREKQVLQLICRELTAAEIAEELHLSVRTVEGYRQKLLEKTGVKNMAGLVVYAIKNNLFEL